MNSGTSSTTFIAPDVTSGGWSANYVISSTNPVYYGSSDETENVISWNISKDKGEKGLHPNLYFKYIKSKFTIFQRNGVEKRLELLEKAFDEAAKNGQEVLAQKFLDSFNLEVKQTALLAKGFNTYIERDVLNKYKNKIRGGHISNTLLKDFTRVIPKCVLDKKKKTDGIFDDYEIFHYWNPDAKDVKKMDAKEKEKMKDPVLFGLIKGSNRLYYIADWEDEYCDLSFSEIVKVVGKGSVKKIDKKPTLPVTVC